MKLDLYQKQNQLDEMQEQTLRKIEARGFWLMWGGLAAAMMIQQLMGVPEEQMAGEFLVFMAGSAYTALESIRNGIWDRRFKPKFGTNLAGSAAAGAAVFALTYLRNGYWPGALLSGGFTLLLTLFVLQTMMSFYEKRHRELEHPKEEYDESED